MALVSPGVEVNVIDESFYTPGAAATVPMIFVATASNKTRASGNGLAQGTTAANAGKAYLITSQRELGDLFGDALFESDNNGNMIHGGELNEYGLNTAYSLLGVTNRAYVVRADVDLAELSPTSVAPGGEPLDGAHWFDTTNTSLGILEWNAAPITTTGGQSFSTAVVRVLTEGTEVTGSGPRGSIGSIGEYALDATVNTNDLYYKSNGRSLNTTSGEWVKVGSAKWKASWPTVSATTKNPSMTNSDTMTINGELITVGGTGTVNGISLTGTVTSSGDLTLGGTLANVDLTTQVTGTLPVANGGTNATTAAGARASLSANALPILKGTSYTANVGEFIVASAGGITITLPATPSAGDTVTVKDGTGDAATTTFTVARNGSNIAASATDLVFDKNYAEITMTYIDGTIGWSV